MAAQLVQFVQKCSTPRDVPVLVAHNGRIFDNRMLMAEFRRSGTKMPSNWLWLDTLPLARQLLQDLKTYVCAASPLALLICQKIDVQT